MDLWRQLDIVAPESLEVPIHVIGCGGIGSMAALALGKMGCSQLHLYDPDSVEDHNVANQFYRLEDIGRHKVVALRAILLQHCDAEVNAHQREVATLENGFGGVVVVGVDTMTARKRLWESARRRPSIQLYVDARMGAEVARIYSVRPCAPTEVDFYEGTLYSDDEADPLPCTARAIVYNTLSIGALIANQVKKAACRQPLSREVVLDLATLTLIADR